jgi:hypothetical protein
MRRVGDPLETQQIRLRGDIEDMRANRGARGMFGERRRRDREVEQAVDPKPRLWIEEVCGRRRIEPQPDGCDLRVAIVAVTSSTSLRRETSSRPRS